MGCQRVCNTKAMATTVEVCKSGRRTGTSPGEASYCGLAARTGTTTREGICRGSTGRREGNTSIRKIDAKAFERTSAPTKSAPGEAREPRTQRQGQGRARLEEGAPLIPRCTTGVRVGHGGVGHGAFTDRGGRYCQPSTPQWAIPSTFFPSTRDNTKGARERAGAETHSRKAWLFADVMPRYKQKTGDADDRAWMTKIWDLEHKRSETLGHGVWSRCPSCAPPPARSGIGSCRLPTMSRGPTPNRGGRCTHCKGI